MPLWVFLLIILTGKVGRETPFYRLVLAIELFMLGWGAAMGRASLVTDHDERRGTAIAGMVLNTLLFLLLGLSSTAPPKPPVTTGALPSLDSQKGRASDR